MKHYIFEGEIRLRRPQGQISQPFWFKNNEKVIFKQDIHQNRPQGQISQPFLLKNDEIDDFWNFFFLFAPCGWFQPINVFLTYDMKKLIG